MSNTQNPPTATHLPFRHRHRHRFLPNMVFPFMLFPPMSQIGIIYMLCRTSVHHRLLCQRWNGWIHGGIAQVSNVLKQNRVFILRSFKSPRVHNLSMAGLIRKNCCNNVYKKGENFRPILPIFLSKSSLYSHDTFVTWALSIPCGPFPFRFTKSGFHISFYLLESVSSPHKSLIFSQSELFHLTWHVILSSFTGKDSV